MKRYISFFILAAGVNVALAGTFVAAKGVSISTDELRSLVFDGSKVDTYFRDGSMMSYDFSSVQRIYFTEQNAEITAATDEQSAELAVYPNPTTESVYVGGAVDGTVVSIIDESGRTVVMRRITGAHDSIEVSFLKGGIYVLMATSADGRTSVFKFIKR